MRFAPTIFKQSTDYTGRVQGKPLYLPGVRDAETGKLVSIVQVRMELGRAQKRAQEMTDSFNKGGR